ncbi:MAG: ABC-F family ATP-binding cassette domain-containing protein [Bacteroidales bacterium]|jgi:ATP-binding cassette subfamily F protein uup|nr:ABC-F family ATP-binding cassette domain-containing protein [Bacteroidales bacterium]
MTAYLTVENLNYHWGDICLFDDISFGINEGQKTALIARNGTGKSTLLNMLTGKMQPDSGRISFNDSIRVGYLEQSPIFTGNNTVIEQVFDYGGDVADTVRQYEQAIASSDENALTPLIEKMDALGAWDFEQRVRQILSQLHITDLSQRIATLSGGQQKRVALAALLISEPNFLILDEPTNHLDLDIIYWLEDYLTRANITLLMVTHDRYFLDRVCNDIIELDNRQIYRYAGNYSYFLQKRQERNESMAAEVDKAKNLLRREQDWMNRQPQARGTKAKYRIDAFYDLKQRAQLTPEQRSIDLKFEAQRMGRKVIDAYGISKSYGSKKIIDEFSYKFMPREKVAIVGPNGAGKTTLLNMLTGNLAPDDGYIETGETISIGYYKQEGIVVDENKKVIEVITDIAENVPTASGSMSAAQFLRFFLFPNELHYVAVNKLSGGERKRLYLLTVLVRNPNFLILDEPTNDLDILTLNVLEDYLQHFNGTVIIVSHDRFFVDKVAEHLFVLDGSGAVKNFMGNYSEYIDWCKADAALRREQHAEEKPKVIVESAKPKSVRKPKLTFAERKEYESLETQIAAATTRKKEIETLLSGGAPLEQNKLMELTSEYEKLSQELDDIEMRWLELDEKNG